MRIKLREKWPVARSRQRRREFDVLFSGVPPGSLGDGLEVGAGDGFMASLLTNRCRKLVASEHAIERLRASQTEAVKVCCDARQLPFRDRSFDFILSSSVLEHIRDRRPVLEEMRRCLKPQGVMVHIMPSNTWKTLQLLLYYPNLLVGGLELVLGMIHRQKPRQETAERWSDQPRCITASEIMRGIVPQVHGEFDGHLEEFSGLREEAWIREFRESGLVVHGVVRLPLFSGYGFGLERPRKLLEHFGLSSHHAFVVGLADTRPCPQAVRFFFPRTSSGCS